jgi:hypothetical protein
VRPEADRVAIPQFSFKAVDQPQRMVERNIPAIGTQRSAVEMVSAAEYAVPLMYLNSRCGRMSTMLRVVMDSE